MTSCTVPFADVAVALSCCDVPSDKDRSPGVICRVGAAVALGCAVKDGCAPAPPQPATAHSRRISKPEGHNETFNLGARAPARHAACTSTATGPCWLPVASRCSCRRGWSHRRSPYSRPEYIEPIHTVTSTAQSPGSCSSKREETLLPYAAPTPLDAPGTADVHSGRTAAGKKWLLVTRVSATATIPFVLRSALT